MPSIRERWRQWRAIRPKGRPVVDSRVEAARTTVWTAIGPALLGLGVAVIVIPWVVIATEPSPHPSVWSNPLFCVLFLLGCLSILAGIYVLAAFIWELPLPQTRHERAHAKTTAAEKTTEVKTARPSPPKLPAYLQERQRQTRRNERRTEQLKRDVRDELVEMIDQGNALFPDAYSSIELAPLKFWQSRAAMFVESVFGALERQRFLESYDPAPKDQSEWLEHRLKRLARLRDTPHDWELQIDRAKFRVVVEVRRYASDADRVTLAGSRAGEAQLPSRGSRSELAVDIRDLADTMTHILKESESREKWEIDDMDKRGSELTPGRSPDLIHRIAVTTAKRRTKTIWLSEQWPTARKLFDEAREFGVVMASDRSQYVDPEPSDVAKVPDAFWGLADRLEQFEASLA